MKTSLTIWMNVSAQFLHRHISSFFFVAAGFGLVFLSAIVARAQVGEVQPSTVELKKLGTFEAHTLGKADQAFAKNQYRQGRAEYDSFILEFPRSKILPYALLRKGRCSQLDGKRFQAIGEYREILDFFPNNVKYAAAALYYIGNCEMANGDEEKAMKAWAKLAEDKEYRKEPLGAYAINHLADYLVKHKKADKAVKYFEQVGVDFRKSNREASDHAREQVIMHWLRTSPNEPNLRKFYTAVGTFHPHAPQTVPEDLNADQAYWNTIRENIRKYGEFFEDEAALKKAYYGYWADQMKGKFIDDAEYGDEFHIDLANFRLAADGNQTAWISYLDRQYDRHQKSGSWKRTVRWMQAYKGNAAKVEQYFRKCDVAKMETAAQVESMKALWDTEDTRKLARELVDKLKFGEISNDQLGTLALYFHEKSQSLSPRFISKIDFAKFGGARTGHLARSFWEVDKTISRMLLTKINYADMKDNEIAGLARGFWHYDGDIVVGICGRFNDKLQGKFELLTYYSQHPGRNPSAGIPLADELVKVEKYAERAWWIKAEMHSWIREYPEAIAAFRNCQNTPSNLWRISDCQRGMRKYDDAISQLREIENFFPSSAAQAALRIAHCYREAGSKKKYITALRAVMKKYPDRNESKEAHVLLEKEGYKPGGGIDAE